jgi:hypothetical protein
LYIPSCYNFCKSFERLKLFSLSGKVILSFLYIMALRKLYSLLVSKVSMGEIFSMKNILESKAIKFSPTYILFIVLDCLLTLCSLEGVSLISSIYFLSMVFYCCLNLSNALSLLIFLLIGISTKDWLYLKEGSFVREKFCSLLEN